MIELTVKNVTEALHEAVKEKGHDFRYVNREGESAINSEGTITEISCYYVHGDKPGCIVANALNRLGVPLEDMSLYEGKTAYQVMRELYMDSIVSYDIGVPYILNMAQELQDKGKTWGEAVDTSLIETEGMWEDNDN